MLDDVERRRFLVNPSRKDAFPAAVGLLHVELDERPGQFLIFPWRARFAGAQADDRVLDLKCLARLQGHIADDAIALVEEAQNGDPLGHGGHPNDSSGTRRIRADGSGACLLAGVAIAAGGGKRKDQHRNGETHAQLGFHA
jgi:hypothetical protein